MRRVSSHAALGTDDRVAWAPAAHASWLVSALARPSRLQAALDTTERHGIHSALRHARACRGGDRVRRVRRMRQQQCPRSVGSHSVLERLQEGGSSAAVPVYAGVEATGTPPPESVELDLSEEVQSPEPSTEYLENEFAPGPTTRADYGSNAHAHRRADGALIYTFDSEPAQDSQPVEGQRSGRLGLAIERMDSQPSAECDSDIPGLQTYTESVRFLETYTGNPEFGGPEELAQRDASPPAARDHAGVEQAADNFVSMMLKLTLGDRRPALVSSRACRTCVHACQPTSRKNKTKHKTKNKNLRAPRRVCCVGAWCCVAGHAAAATP